MRRILLYWSQTNNTIFLIGINIAMKIQSQSTFVSFNSNPFACNRYIYTFWNRNRLFTNT